MKINGYQIEGSKSDYIDILIKYHNMDKKTLENKTFKDVVLEYCFYYQPLVLLNHKGK
jgi:hypothetical protein